MCRSHWKWLTMETVDDGPCFGEEAGARNLGDFSDVKWLGGGDEWYLVCAAGAAAVVPDAKWFLLCVLQRVCCSCVRSSDSFLEAVVADRIGSG